MKQYRYFVAYGANNRDDVSNQKAPEGAFIIFICYSGYLLPHHQAYQLMLSE
ncbi:MAG: hypothetical protein AAB611_01300 [Patescibacteria group bacterium]